MKPPNTRRRKRLTAPVITAVIIDPDKIPHSGDTLADAERKEMYPITVSLYNAAAGKGRGGYERHVRKGSPRYEKLYAATHLIGKSTSYGIYAEFSREELASIMGWMR